MLTAAGERIGDPIESDGSHITAKQVARLERYVARVLVALEAPFWRVYVAKDEPPDGALLMIEPTPGRRIAGLYVSPAWLADDDRVERRANITHECLHLLHHDLDEVVRHFRNTNEDVGESVLAVMYDQFETETERIVDSLAYLLAPHMPECPKI